jgi:hypothetical protein
MFIRDVLIRLNAEPTWIAQTGWHSVLWPFVIYGLAVALFAVASRIPFIRRLFP